MFHRHPILCLFVLAVLFVNAVEAGRFAWASWESHKLEKKIIEVREKVAPGQSRLEYLNTRPEGRNGWVESNMLCSEEGNSWISNADQNDVYHRLLKLEDSSGNPPDADRLLRESDHLAAVYERIADFDVIAPVPRDEAELNHLSSGDFFVGRQLILETMIGRCLLLFMLGRTEQANAELLNAAKVWSKYTYPLSFGDWGLAVVGRRKILDFTLRHVQSNDVTREAALQISTLVYEPFSIVHRAIEAQVVTDTAFLQTEFIPRSPGSWFDWVWDERANGADPFAGWEHSSRLRRWRYWGYFAREFREGLHDTMASLEFTQQAPPWYFSRGTDRGKGEGSFGIPTTTLERRLMDALACDAANAAILLALLQRDGPLYRQRELVRIVMGGFPWVQASWEGREVVLAPLSPFLAEGQTTSEASDAGDHVIRLVPLEKSATNHEQD